MTPRSIIQFALRLKSQGVRYVQSLSWLISDSVHVAPRIWLRIIIATLLSLGSNAAVVGVIYFYVKLLEQNISLQIFSYEFVARQSVFLLVLFVLAMAITMLVFATSDYVGRSAALLLHRDYEIASLRRNLELTQHLPDPRCPEVSQLIDGLGLSRLVSNYPHSCSWSLRFIATAVPNLVLFVAGYAAILWLDPQTTFIVTVFGILVVAAQYPIHLFAAKSSNVLEETAPYTSAKKRALIERSSRLDCLTTPKSLQTELEGYLQDRRVQRNINADVDRFRAMEMSAWSMQTGGTIVLGAMLLTIGLGLLNESSDWAILVVYLTLLRRLLNSVTTIFRAVTVFSRYSPHVQISRAFVLGASRALASSPGPDFVPEYLTLAAARLGPDPSPSATLQLTAGTAFCLASAGGLKRDVAISLQRAIADIRENSAQAPPHLFAAAAETRTRDAAEKALAAADESRAAVVLVDRALFGILEPARKAAWKQRFADRYLGIVYPAAAAPVFGESVLLARDRAGKLYWTPIPEQGLADASVRTIASILAAGVSADAKAALADDDMG